MPPIETSDRHDYLVIWTSAGHTRTGDKTVNTGTQLQVRWEDEISGNRPDKSDEEQYDAKIIVAEDVAIGSIVWQGMLTDLPIPIPTVTSLYEVISFKKVPDVKGRNLRRICLVKKWSNTLPTIV
jgi:hypothetical protein|tara:strand:- start:256 stop:630 length:375 start_codon:yes stop_codon:yes gene_type:complete